MVVRGIGAPHRTSGRALLALLLAGASPSCGSDARHSTDRDSGVPPALEGPAASVNVFVGTADADRLPSKTPVGGAGGSTFPGAALPFGRVQFGPDTTDVLPGGYRFGENRVFGFSTTHLNGAGCPIFRDVPFLPALAPPDPSSWEFPTFAHENESAHAGYYSALLDTRIRVELTATQRTALARVHFPGDAAYLLFPSEELPDAGLTQSFDARVADSELVTGSRVAGPFCFVGDSRYTLHFAIRFDRTFAEVGSWAGGRLHPESREAQGKQSGLYFRFDVPDARAVSFKVGLSYVSASGALANLDAESRGWDFDRRHADAIAAWNERLGRVEIDGGDDAERTLFYTALYRTLLQPAVSTDVDGTFIDFGGAVKDAGARPRYANFSGWDVYRSWVQLASVVAPDETSDLMQSLVDAADSCGALPKWSLGSDETAVMVGDPAAPAVASAWAFGARDFDGAAALRHLKRGATEPGTTCNGERIRPGLAEYLERGFVPVDGQEPLWGPVSTTLEYAVADFSIGRFAAALGDGAAEREFTARGRYWKNVFDPGHAARTFTGYVQPRLATDVAGGPAFQRADVTSDSGFVEGNAAQYTWMVPHDVPGLVAALGGPQATIARLDDFFAELNAGTAEPHFYMGNEPLFGAPWLYSFVGKPGKTQEAVRRIVRTAFATTPGGLPGNDDLGATSSWLAWALLGLYPAIPGEGVLVIGRPAFPRATIRLAGGKLLELRAKGTGDYVHGLAVNGTPWPKPWIDWTTLAGGAVLEFELGDAPHPTWGTGVADAPPAFAPPPN